MVDLTGDVVPTGRLIRCARVLVAATALAGCGGNAARPVETAAVPPAVTVETEGTDAGELDGATSIEEMAPPSSERGSFEEWMAWSGHVRVTDDGAADARDGGTLKRPKPY